MLPRRLLFAVVLVLVIPGCEDDPNLKDITVAQLSAIVSTASIFDVNGDKVRKEFGIIPGAKLLGDADDYDTASMLGGDKAKTLVFYCSNSWCSAARTAAKRARTAGYNDVNVLPVGIKGWKEAGEHTDEI